VSERGNKKRTKEIKEKEKSFSALAAKKDDRSTLQSLMWGRCLLLSRLDKSAPKFAEGRARLALEGCRAPKRDEFQCSTGVFYHTRTSIKDKLAIQVGRREKRSCGLRAWTDEESARTTQPSSEVNSGGGKNVEQRHIRDKGT